MDIRPIRNEADYEWALREVEPYFDTPPAPGTAAADRFDVLTDLIAAYEARRWSIEPLDPVDAIRFKMQQDGLTQTDLADVLGSKSRASEVLHRKRSLTLDMVHRLTNAWGIPAEVLVRPYRLAAA